MLRGPPFSGGIRYADRSSASLGSPRLLCHIWKIAQRFSGCIIIIIITIIVLTVGMKFISDFDIILKPVSRASKWYQNHMYDLRKISRTLM